MHTRPQWTESILLPSLLANCLHVEIRMCSQAPIQVETLGSLRCGNRKKTVPGRPGAGRGFAFPGSAATRSTARGVTLLAGPRPREYEYAESESR